MSSKQPLPEKHKQKDGIRDPTWDGRGGGGWLGIVHDVIAHVVVGEVGEGVHVRPQNALAVELGLFAGRALLPRFTRWSIVAFGCKKGGKMKLFKFVSIHDVQKIYITYVSIISLHNLLALTYDMT